MWMSLINFWGQDDYERCGNKACITLNKHVTVSEKGFFLFTTMVGCSLGTIGHRGCPSFYNQIHTCSDFKLCVRASFDHEQCWFYPLYASTALWFDTAVLSSMCKCTYDGVYVVTVHLLLDHLWEVKVMCTPDLENTFSFFHFK